MLERLARFVGADSAVLAVRARRARGRDAPAVTPGTTPTSARSAVPDADWPTGTDEVIGSVTLAWRTGPADVDPRGARAARGRRRRARLDAGARPGRAGGADERGAVPLARRALVGLHAACTASTGDIQYLSPSTARFSGFEVGSELRGLRDRAPGRRGRWWPRCSGRCAARGRGATSPPVRGADPRRANGEYRWLEMIATNLSTTRSSAASWSTPVTSRNGARPATSSQRINESLEQHQPRS